MILLTKIKHLVTPLNKNSKVYILLLELADLLNHKKVADPD